MPTALKRRELSKWVSTQGRWREILKLSPRHALVKCQSNKQRKVKKKYQRFQPGKDDIDLFFPNPPS